MKLRSVIGVLFVLVSGACRSRPSTSERPLPPHDVVAKASSSSSASASPSSSVAAPTLADDSYPPDARVVSTSRGGLVVYADTDEVVHLQPLDASGTPVGARSIVAGVTTPFDVDVRAGRAWILWTTTEDFVWTYHALALDDATRSIAVPPFTIATETVLGDPNVFPARVLARADGSAIALVSGPEAPAPCVGHDPFDKTPCKGPSFEVFAIGPATPPNRLFRRALDGGQFSANPMIDARDAIVVSVLAWHGGPVVADLLVRDGKAVDVGAACAPPIVFAFTGKTFVQSCPADYPMPGDACDDKCDRIVPDALHPSSKSPLVLKKVTHCADGHPIVDLAYAGGTTRLDPTAPGASMHPFDDDAVWLGGALVSLGDDGHLVRATCDGDALVRAR